MAGKLLPGKKVLITGASKGIGKELATACSREGAHLILCCETHSKDDLEQCSEQCKSGGCSGCECHCMDLTQGDSLTSWAQDLVSKYGCIDVLINNAGVFGPPKAEDQGPLEGNPDDWARMMDVNVKAPMRLTRALAPAMAKKGNGMIINIGDAEATHTGPHHPAYAASKYALRGWSMSCYEALRQKNVKVVLINPGNVEGTRMAKQTDKQGDQGTITSADVVEAVLFAFRLSSNCVPEEITIKAVQPAIA